jgi:mannose-6-phosphate isomerase-like protein (cupin superfamily)
MFGRLAEDKLANAEGSLSMDENGIDADERPWGRWQEYLTDTGYRVKRIIVHPGQRLSLQRHQVRSEHWAIVAGKGLFTLDESVTEVTVGDAVFIPVRAGTPDGESG